MATVRGKPQMTVGSTQWIAEQKEQIEQFRGQELEDFAFTARNEVEWLNEHMAGIFSNTGLNITEICKSPVKLRGKTPRTARKANPLETRAPLTDIFSASVALNNIPLRNSPFMEKVGKMQNAHSTAVPSSKPSSPSKNRSKANTDSGYQSAYRGTSEDEMDVDKDVTDLPVPAVTRVETLDSEEMQLDHADTRQTEPEQASENDRTTDGSFHSARENVTSRDILQTIETVPSGQQLTDTAELGTTNIESAKSPTPDPLLKSPERQLVADDEKDTLSEDEPELDVSHTPSDGSSPAKPLVRKSSLTFASLPAREPLTTTKSIGARLSRTSNLDQAKVAALNRNSYLGRLTGGKSIGGIKQPEALGTEDHEDEMDIGEAYKPALTREETDSDGAITRLHNKASTQSLQERINRLTQTQPGRLQKFGASTAAQPGYPELPKSSMETQEEGHIRSRQADKIKSNIVPVAIDDDDEWIKPVSQKLDMQTQLQAAKVVSTNPAKHYQRSDQDYEVVQVESEPSRHGTLPKKFVSVSIPDQSTIASTTPSGSPPRRHHHEVNASKSKLQSIMKSARGLFTSSAGASAQAKMETLSGFDARTSTADPSRPSHSLYPSLPNGPEVSLSDNLPSKDETRKTRSSSEKEQKRKDREAKNQQQAEADFKGGQEQDVQKSSAEESDNLAVTLSSSIQIKNAVEVVIQRESKPVRQSPRRQQNHEEPDILEANETNTARVAVDQIPAQSMAPPPPRSNSQQSNLQKGKTARRPIKPTKEVAPKPKPQPVAIRFGTLLGLSQRAPLTNAALSSSLQDSLPPQQSRQPTVTKKASNSSLQTSTSAASIKNYSLSSKPKSLIAAERLRKKEQDGKSAQRKAEENREVERKRQVQQEEAEHREQQKRQEAERLREKQAAAAAAEAKKAASKLVAEKKKLEANNKPGSKDIHGVGKDLAAALQQEKQAPIAPTSRQELGAAKPVSKPNLVQDFPRAPNGYPAPNPAKPPVKRVFQPDDDEDFRPARAPTAQNYQANESKRRRTEDEDVLEAPVRSIMAPPLRQSNIRKDGPQTSIFGNSYSTTSMAATSHQSGATSLKSSALNQPYQQNPYASQAPRPAHPLDMAKYTSGKIPFAEAPNPPPPNHKTPLMSKQGMANAAKSSPSFPHGENIHLDDIPTDSDEEDSDAEKERKRNLPEWVLTPNLDERLREQERLNPDVLFGPIAPLVMEEIFKDKNRHHRFRSRTSSANWFGQDKLTEEEVRADNAARERLRREGGWTFGL